MGATVQLSDGTVAMAEDYTWQCDNPAVKVLLSTLLDPWGPLGSDPNPDLTLAQRAIDWLGGKILHFDPTETDEILPPGEWN